MLERVLTRREPNGALPARQLLLRRMRLPVGRVIEREDGRVEPEPFAPLPARVRRELEHEAEGLEALHR